jgi:hypothetical protein
MRVYEPPLRRARAPDPAGVRSRGRTGVEDGRRRLRGCRDDGAAAAAGVGTIHPIPPPFPLYFAAAAAAGGVEFQHCFRASGVLNGPKAVLKISAEILGPVMP